MIVKEVGKEEIIGLKTSTFYYFLKDTILRTDSKWPTVFINNLPF
jgi:hypothetical protein